MGQQQSVLGERTAARYLKVSVIPEQGNEIEYCFKAEIVT